MALLKGCQNLQRTSDRFCTSHPLHLQNLLKAGWIGRNIDKRCDTLHIRTIPFIKLFLNLQGLNQVSLKTKVRTQVTEDWVAIFSEGKFPFNIMVTENSLMLSQVRFIISKEHTHLPLFNFLESFWVSWRRYFRLATFLSIRLIPARGNNIYSYHKIVRQTAS